MSFPEVKIEVFEGPFDLLLELAGQRRIDLAEVSLAALTDDFLRYLEEHEVSPQAQGEWLVVAAQLLLLKARFAAKTEVSEEQEEEEVLRKRVRMYQLYRSKAELLRSVWGERRLQGRGERQQTPLPPAIVTAGELQAAFGRVLKRLPQPERARAHLVRYGRSLDECLVALRSVLKRKSSFVFQQEVRDGGRADTAVSFLALLELHRSNQVVLDQGGNFEPLTVRRV